MENNTTASATWTCRRAARNWIAWTRISASITGSGCSACTWPKCHPPTTMPSKCCGQRRSPARWALQQEPAGCAGAPHVGQHHGDLPPARQTLSGPGAEAVAKQPTASHASDLVTRSKPLSPVAQQRAPRSASPLVEKQRCACARPLVITSRHHNQVSFTSSNGQIALSSPQFRQTQSRDQTIAMALLISYLCLSVFIGG